MSSLDIGFGGGGGEPEMSQYFLECGGGGRGGDPLKHRKSGKEPNMSRYFSKGDGILSNGFNYILYMCRPLGVSSVSNASVFRQPLPVAGKADRYTCGLIR